MKRFPLQRRTLALIAVIVPLLALFGYVVVRSGPLAPVPVTVVTVEARPINPSIFGIGTVEARYTYKIGPTVAGRVKQLDVHVGDRVKAGQSLGEMDPVDLEERIRAQDAALKRSEAALRESIARQSFAQTQARRYEQLFATRSTSEELLITKRQELQIADAALSGARQELARLSSERDALIAQKRNLKLVAPVDGLVVARDADPGTTVVAGQAVVEVIDPRSLWINARFDQINASGLAQGLPARIALRSRTGASLDGRVLRTEPVADAVTEETLAKVLFANPPDPLPPIGELAEVTIALPALATAPVIPNAAIRREAGKTGVWKIVDGDAQFVTVRLGAADLDGHVQILEGVEEGERVVVYSERALTKQSRIHVASRIPGVSP
jgi:RND family efflux transporter MFP subunit